MEPRRYQQQPKPKYGNSVKDWKDEDKPYFETGNLGLLYTRRYYDGLESTDKEQGKYYEKRNANLLKQAKNVFNESELLECINREENPGSRTFSAKTLYPGLITGIGLSHSCNHTGELKFGMAFDHTTGMPYLPASSIKGSLRSVFPTGDSETDALRAAFISEKLGKKQKLEVRILQQLAVEIFGSEQDDVKQHIKGKDVFFDAFPDPKQCGKNGLLKIDYITPHTEGEFAEPKPISFMCIAPDVVFRFAFILTQTCIGDITIAPDEKCQLFKCILENIGIGAKTNVGYGRLEYVEESFQKN